MLIEAIKELNAENDTVKSENKELKENLLAMGTWLEALDTMILAVSNNFHNEKLAKVD